MPDAKSDLKDDGELKEFFYQLKTLEKDHFYAKIWHIDIISAKDKKSAKAQIESELDVILAEKITKKETKAEFKIFIVELTNEWRKHWTTVHVCKVCETPYTHLMKKQMNEYCNSEVCSDRCNLLVRKDKIDEYRLQYGKSPPCIYKITNKESGMVYIGQTTQPVTLRWYQHMFHLTGTKFHEHVLNSKIDDWQFEVIEVVKDVKTLNEREQHWINHYDSINSGYNTATAKAEDKSKKRQKSQDASSNNDDKKEEENHEYKQSTENL
ncbi:GIY-YIG nuclease family protein [Bdellovibrio sp. BCCA]|uniref:GIY-YIG nuclease family protein n=1 Tax=Bdellovibrio sp. BCCA TaxID=3136281 RepID=UPI0030F2A207